MIVCEQSLTFNCEVALRLEHVGKGSENLDHSWCGYKVNKDGVAVRGREI